MPPPDSPPPQWADDTHDEVEALRAIYGDAQISFNPAAAATPASISISLRPLLPDQPHPAGSTLTLSALLPSSYPHTSRPQNPTLRSDALSSATCTALLNRMLERQTAAQGDVCLFEYCEAMLEVLADFAAEFANRRDIDAGESGGNTVVSDEAVVENKFVVFHGDPLTDRKSVFQAHMARVTSVEDVDDVLRQLRQASRKVATATHNSFAYRVDVGGKVVQDVDDDGEKGAGKCMLFVLQQMNVVNCVVVVSRWFGGVLLGPARFRHIGKVTRDLMEQYRGEFVEGGGS